jgi:large conductance mechanosensitive channel
MSTMSEFREFIARGNVVDLAVGVIIGGAFGKIVTSLVDQVVMPPIGLALGGLDFSKLEIVLRPDDPATKASELVAIQYGAFLNTVIQFLIVAWVVFLMVKAVNAARRIEAADPAPEAPPAPTPTESLLVEIRDLLKPAPVAVRAAPAPKAVAAKARAKQAAKPAAKAKAPAAKPKK